MNRIIYTHKKTVYLTKINVRVRYTVIRMTRKNFLLHNRCLFYVAFDFQPDA